MRRYGLSIRGCVGLLVAGVWLGGCAGDSDPAEAPEAVVEDLVSAELLQSTWPVVMADDAARAPFESHEGWAAFFQRNYADALQRFGADASAVRAQARAHVELAALYRQAALLAANATRHVYGSDRQADVDPPAVDYVVAVADALVGKCEEASKRLATFTSEDAPAAGVAFWRKMTAEAPCGEVSLDSPEGAFPRPIEPVAAGSQPTMAPTPHYSWKEQGEGGGAVDVSDPAALLALAKWHEAAARSLVPENEAVLVDALVAPWRLKGEQAAELDISTVPPEWLFAGFALSAGDLVFLADAGTQGTAAVEKHSLSSPLAAALRPAVDGERLDPDKVLDLAPVVGRQVSSAMEARSGSVQAFHRPFAEVARVAVLRAGMVVADGAGQYRDSGILRINALERSTDGVADPVFLMASAAWDAGNRNPLRAQEIVHSLVRTYPSVASARTPLDALHIRLSRNTTSGGPVF